ncbi:Protein FAR1-RELATED SEQUENCE 7 [Linum perenne]
MEKVIQDEEHTVTFKVDPFDYDCSCDLFDSSGWLCRHIMKTMDTVSSSGITAAWTIPSKFLLSRWSTNAKIGGAIHGCAVECFDMETQFGHFQRLCGSALPLATDASQHVQITDFVAEQLQQLHEDVCAKLLHPRFVEPTQSPATPSVCGGFGTKCLIVCEIGEACLVVRERHLISFGYLLSRNSNRPSRRLSANKL